MKHIVRIFCILMLTLFSGNVMAAVIELVPDANKSINGAGSQGNFSTAASLLYGMPFELSFDVTTAESGPSMNQWGSAILTTGTSPFDTPANGIQIYLHAEGNNGGQLLIAANGQKFFFSNVVYNTDKFNVHLIQSNGQLTMEVTNNAVTTGTVDDSIKTIRYTKPMMFNQIDRLCYAMPTGMNVSNLSLTVQTADMTNYINNIMPLAPGYLTEEAREYIVGQLESSGEKLQIYKDFIAASTNGADINGKRSYMLPDPGKVYMMGNYIKNGNVKNYLTLWENKDAGTANLVIEGAFNPSDWLNQDGTHKMDNGDDLYMQNLFSYLWIPRTKGSDNVMTFYHATGLGYSLDYSVGVKRDNPTSWNMEHGLELGYLAMKSTVANKYVAANSAKTAFGAWGTGGMFASGKAQGNNWSTDFFFEEVSGFVPYDLNIIGLTSSDTYADGGTAVDPATAKVQYQVQAGNYVDITNGGVILVGEGNESSLLSDLKSVDVNNKFAVITVGNGIITVEYTDFNTRKNRAEAELNAASTRLEKFSAGALYSETAITAARDAITAAESKVSTDPKGACADLESAMETFYKTIDGRFVTMTNQTNNLLATQSHTSLCAKEKSSTDEKPNYYGVYQLHYIGNGAYQLRNAYHDNYVGQTTSATTVNSATNQVASRWRGTFSFDMHYSKRDVAEAYSITCINGAINNGKYYVLGVNGSTIVRTDSLSNSTLQTSALWDVRLVDVKTYADAYKTAASTSVVKIGFAPSKSVYDALSDAITACPVSPTAEQETTLSHAINHYIDHMSDINKPAHGQYVTFQNRATTTVYIGENLYEMKPSTTLDLGCVWETIIDGDKYYFRNLKSGMYMGKVTQSAIGRLTIKNNGANKQEIDIIKAPNREQGEGFVALHEMGTNTYRSFIHHATNGRNDIVGWESAPEASHWTINAVSDGDLKDYLATATGNVKTQLSTDLAAYNALEDTPGNYEKSSDVKVAATTAATVEWPTSPTKEAALQAYKAAVDAFNAFTTAGTPMENNEMFLIKTSIDIPNQSGSDAKKYFVTQVLNDYGKNEGGSLTNGIQSSDTDDFYLFTLWQAIKEGGYYKLYNFYTGHYLSKDISMSDDHNNRYGLTTIPDEAALFTITPQHGCFVSFHRSDYDEMNDGYLKMITTPKGSRTMFGLAQGNITTPESGRMLFELEPSTTKHYEKCLASMLNYEIGNGVGKYTDVSGNYSSERDKVRALLNASTQPANYASLLQNAAKEFAPVLAGLKINLPEPGKYYRLYSQVSTGANSGRYYLTNANPSSTAAMVKNAGGDNIKGSTTSVFYYDGSHLLSYGNGYYLGNTYTPWTMGGIGEKFEFDFANTGYKNKGCYSIKPRGRSYLYNNINQLNGWSSAFNERCEWYLEEVTDLPLVVSNLGYSTFYSARSHKIPDGVACYTAYVVEGNQTDGGKVILSLIRDNYIPANVAVLVKANQGTYYFSEPTGYIADRDYSNNLFLGQIETILSGYTADDCKQYTLQKLNDTVGFYKYTGATLAGFKGYMDINSVPSSAQGKPLMFSFDDEEATGISHLINICKENAVYDLYGRKVKTPSSGIYIVNGKKVFINK